MNKQINLNFGKWSVSLQIRDNAKTRFDDIVIDESKRKEAVSSIDIDSIRARAKALRAIHQEG